VELAAGVVVGLDVGGGDVEAGGTSGLGGMVGGDSGGAAGSGEAAAGNEAAGTAATGEGASGTGDATTGTALGDSGICVLVAGAALSAGITTAATCFSFGGISIACPSQPIASPATRAMPAAAKILVCWDSGTCLLIGRGGGEVK